jgi:hypothetical protein
MGKLPSSYLFRREITTYAVACLPKSATVALNRLFELLLI